MDVKFLLVPLLIIGMFVSFTAVLMALLLWTETVKSPEELWQIVQGQVDSTKLSEEFVDPEDRLGQLTAMVEDYRSRYQAQLDSVTAKQDSLAAVEAALAAREQALAAQQEQVQQVADSTRARNRLVRLDELATFYNKVKPQPAAEILQEGTLDDTTVAMLMRKLQPQHMAKIMAAMNADNAARITKIMQELK